jgi:hypothetical protein
MPYSGQQLGMQNLIDRGTRKDIACEFIKGLKFGFPLNYSGPRSPITSKNLKSVADMPEHFPAIFPPH